MAYWIRKAGHKHSLLWRFFLCDHLSDIQLLPTVNRDGQPQQDDPVCCHKCYPGSKCLCLEDGSVWILGKETDKWIKRKESPSAGGIPDYTTYTPITEEEINALFE